jgi:hypothetical protein
MSYIGHSIVLLYPQHYDLSGHVLRALKKSLLGVNDEYGCINIGVVI